MQVICSTAPDVQVELTTNVVFQPSVATFENVAAPGIYSLFVDGTISTASIAVTAAAGAAPGGAPVASLPITVNRVLCTLELY